MKRLEEQLEYDRPMATGMYYEYVATLHGKVVARTEKCLGRLAGEGGQEYACVRERMRDLREMGG